MATVSDNSGIYGETQSSGLKPAYRRALRRDGPIVKWLLKVAAGFVLPLFILGLWQSANTHHWVSPQILPPPGDVLHIFFELLLDGQIAGDLAISLKRIFVGFGWGASAGLALGIGLSLSPRLESIFAPTLKALGQIPAIGWIPVLILIFGLDETVKYLIIAKVSFIPIFIASLDGMRAIPEKYHDVARVLRLRLRTRLWRFWLPAALPQIFIGLRLGLSGACIALIIVEMLAASEGVGYMMVWGRKLFQLDIVIVGVVVIGFLGFAIDTALAGIERRLHKGVRRFD